MNASHLAPTPSLTVPFALRQRDLIGCANIDTSVVVGPNGDVRGVTSAGTTAPFGLAELWIRIALLDVDGEPFWGLDGPRLRVAGRFDQRGPSSQRLDLIARVEPDALAEAHYAAIVHAQANASPSGMRFTARERAVLIPRARRANSLSEES